MEQSVDRIGERSVDGWRVSLLATTYCLGMVARVGDVVDDGDVMWVKVLMSRFPLDKPPRVHWSLRSLNCAGCW